MPRGITASPLRFACLFLLCGLVLAWNQIAVAAPEQFILFNLNWPVEHEVLSRISRDFKPGPGASVRVGVSAIFSYLRQPREQSVADLRGFLQGARKTDLPVVVQLDGENWWEARPDLWNWWDAARAGYSPANRTNVEWTSWSPDDAIKIAWRNWGQQLRVLPPPNLMSERYRAACHEEMRILIPIILEWWRALAPDKKYLLVGIKLGHESSIGVNAWHYPDGNRRLDQPAGDDPITGLKLNEVPSRGVAQIGYAAVKTAGLRTEGQITESDIAEVVRRHLEDLCRLAAQLGVPRERLFTHAGGWKDNEMLYQAALNKYSCPGWSFYNHADDPGKDAGVQSALRRSDAPRWAAVEWLFQGQRELAPWKSALEKTLQPRCRYVCIFNWNGVCNSPAILQAVHDVAR